MDIMVKGRKVRLEADFDKQAIKAVIDGVAVFSQTFNEMFSLLEEQFDKLDRLKASAAPTLPIPTESPSITTEHKNPPTQVKKNIAIH